jgi:hypothetical protein
MYVLQQLSDVSQYKEGRDIERKRARGRKDRGERIGESLIMEGKGLGRA